MEIKLQEQTPDESSGLSDRSFKIHQALEKFSEDDSITMDWLIKQGFGPVDASMSTYSLGILEFTPEFIDRLGDIRWVICRPGGTFVSIPKELKPRTKEDVLWILKKLSLAATTTS